MNLNRCKRSVITKNSGGLLLRKFSLFVKILFITSVLLGILVFKPPTEIKLEESHLPAFTSFSHPLGSDRLGRDIYAMYSYGVVSTFIFSIPARFVTIVFSTLLVFFSYWMGRQVLYFIEILSSVFISIPSLLIALVSVYTLGFGFFTQLYAIVLSDWAMVYESVQGKIREIRNRGNVIASICFGGSRFHVFKEHILTEALSIIYILFLTGIPSVVMTVSIFNYLGIDFGAEFLGPGLGEQISFSKDYFEKSPLSLITPTLGIFLSVFLFGKSKI